MTAPLAASGPGPVQFSRVPLRLDATHRYETLKDPCLMHDGEQWHLFGSGYRTGSGRLEIMHATADHPAGSWSLEPAPDIECVEGSCVAAPGVVAEDGQLHMFVQTEFNRLGGRVEHLVSADGGRTFSWRGTALQSAPGTGEAGLYDPHPARIGAERYVVYSGFSIVGQPDIFLARSTTDSWTGPYERLGRILEHPHVPGHNQVGDGGYEWGLEGAQLVELPDGRVLLHAVCFLAAAPHGCRQRLFLAVADAPVGPYRVLGPALEPAGGMGAGENGHGSAVVQDGDLLLLFQERRLDGPWGYGLAHAPLHTHPLFAA